MLFKIQKELLQNRAMKLAFSVESNREQYEKLKREYAKFSTVVKQKKLTSQMKIFLLLVSVKTNDIEFASQLINIFDYKKMNSFPAKLALGRYYEKIGDRKGLIESYLAVYEEDLLEEHELLSLSKELYEVAFYGDCDKVYQFALNKYPSSLSWKIEVLNYQIKISHLYPNHKESILGNLKYLYPYCELYQDFFNMGICFSSAGYLNDAIKMYDVAFQKIQPNLAFEEIKLPFDANQCRESMDEIIDILEAFDYQPFPIGGSLLGLFRDGKFMDHDKDADIGLFVKDYNEICQIVANICEHKQFICPNMMNKPKESNYWNVAIQDHNRNIVIDLFFFYHDQNNIVEGLHSPCGILKWSFTPFTLVRYELVGKLYWVPNDIELFLTDLFGANWTQSIKVWDSLLNCPNLTKDSSSAVIFYGLMRLYVSIDENKITKAENYYKTLSERWGVNFSPAAEANIKRYLTSSH